MSTVDKAVQSYIALFGEKPLYAAAAPGRVEIMGNHTDYNGGFVLPAALDKYTAVVGSPRTDDTIVLYAADYSKKAEFQLNAIVKDKDNSWADYVLGVVEQLKQINVALSGFQAVIQSDVPTGAGLSSSAALEVATALFLREFCPYTLEPMEIARLCQRAENLFVGVNCGILDQFSSLFGKDDSLLFLDCMSLKHDIVQMGRHDISVVICDSRVKHSLTGGDYNTRRGECMAAAEHFGKNLLREVAWEDFVAGENELPENQRKRARHVLTEDKRVLSMRAAIQGTDTADLGKLLAEGHASCRDLFENSTPEIDYLVDAATKIEGCIGAKLTGGGWGGCSVNLVFDNAVDNFVKELAALYKNRFERNASIYASRASMGAHAVKL